MGIGGLGHMAVKFAVARGNVVTAISSGAAKAAAAQELGATHYLDASNAAALAAAADSLDVVIVTGASGDLDHKFLINVGCRD